MSVYKEIFCINNECILKMEKEIFEKEQRFYIVHVDIKRKSFSMRVYIEKKFFVYRNVGVQM